MAFTTRLRPVDNIKFDPKTVLKFPFKQVTYTLFMDELEHFLVNKSIFGGRMHARTNQTRGGQPVMFANHGALVARPEEPSLRRFVDDAHRNLVAGQLAGKRETDRPRANDQHMRTSRTLHKTVQPSPAGIF